VAEFPLIKFILTCLVVALCDGNSLYKALSLIINGAQLNS